MSGMAELCSGCDWHGPQYACPGLAKGGPGNGLDREKALNWLVTGGALNGLD